MNPGQSFYIKGQVPAVRWLASNDLRRFGCGLLQHKPLNQSPLPLAQNLSCDVNAVRGIKEQFFKGDCGFRGDFAPYVAGFSV